MPRNRSGSRPRSHPHRSPSTPSASSARSIDERLGARAPLWYAAILAAIVLIVFRDFVLAQKTYLFKDIGSDTLNVFYPSLVHVARLLRGGLPGWSFAQGMGQDVFPNSLGDPFNDLLYLLGPQGLAHGIAFVELLKLVCAGVLFYSLLRLRGMTGFSSAVGGLCYAFCGSIVVGGTWYVFSTMVVEAALLLVAFELLFQRRHRWMFPLAVAIGAASNAFNLYLFGVLLLAYAAVRFFEDDGRSRWSLGSLVAWTVGLGLVGLAMSAVFVLPSAWELLHSPRVQGEASLSHRLRSFPMLGLGGANLYASVVLRLFSNDLLRTGSEFKGWTNYLEAPMHYSGLVTLLLAPQAFAQMRGRARIAYAVVAALLLLIHVFPWPRYAFWLFAGDYFRTLSLFVTLLFLGLSVRALDAVVRQGALNSALLGGTVLALLILLFWPFYSGAAGTGRIDPDLRAGVALLLVLECCCLLALPHARIRFAAQVATLVVVGIELAVLSSVSLNGRTAVTVADLGKQVGYNDETVEAIERLRRLDHGFFRVQKSYSSSPAMHSSLNDAKVQDYYSTSAYSSFNQPNYIRFLAGAGIVDPKVELETRWPPGLRQRPILQSFASVRYWLWRGDYRSVGFLRNYDVVDSVGGVAILRNRNFIPLGFAVTSFAREAGYRSLTETQKDVGLLQCAVVEDESAARAGLAEWRPDQIPTPYTNEAFDADTRRCADQALQGLEVGRRSISGRITTNAASMLVLSIPFDPGWNATVDDREVALERVDFGLSGILLTAGDHAVRLAYRTPLLGMGAWISLVGLIVWLGFVFFGKLRGQRRDPSPGVTQ